MTGRKYKVTMVAINPAINQFRNWQQVFDNEYDAWDNLTLRIKIMKHKNQMVRGTDLDVKPIELKDFQ